MVTSVSVYWSPAGYLCESLDGGAVFAVEGVGDVWHRPPVIRVHRGPAQRHLRRLRRRRQGRPFPQLVTELLPRGASDPIRVYRKNRVLPGRTKVPIVHMIAVQVPGSSSDRCRWSPWAPANSAVVLPSPKLPAVCPDVCLSPVASGEGALVRANQPTGIGIARHIARGIAGANLARGLVDPHQPAHVRDA